jgi:hypothetical protein
MKTGIIFFTVLALVACASLADHHHQGEKKKIGEYEVAQTPDTHF